MEGELPTRRLTLSVPPRFHAVGRTRVTEAHRALTKSSFQMLSDVLEHVVGSHLIQVEKCALRYFSSAVFLKKFSLKSVKAREYVGGGRELRSAVWDGVGPIARSRGGGQGCERVIPANLIA